MKVPLSSPPVVKQLIFDNKKAKISVLFHFGPFKNIKKTFNLRGDAISSKLKSEQWRVTLYMFNPRGQMPKFWPKWPKILVLRKYLTILKHVIMKCSIKMYSGQSMAVLFKINGKTVGANPIYGLPGWSNIQILTKNDLKYYSNNFPIWTIW